MTTLLDKKRSATSNVQSPDKATLDQVLSRIAALAPMVARLAPDIEQGRRLPTELVSALKSARIYGVLVPQRYGGLELDPLSSFQAVAALPWPGQARWVGGLDCHDWPHRGADTVAGGMMPGRSASLRPARSTIG